MLGLFDLIILAIIGIIVVLLFRKIFAKTGFQFTLARSRSDSLPEPPKKASNPSSFPPADPHAKPSSLTESDGESPAPMGVGWRPTSGSLSTPETQQTEPPPLFSKTKIVGYVRGLSQRTAQPNLQIYSFRVETFDAQGNRLPPVTVEMNGIGFEGSLNEGDQVKINKKPRPGKAIKIDRLTNITAGSTFKVTKYPLFVRILAIPMTLIGWIITAAFVIGFFALLYALIRDLS